MKTVNDLLGRDYGRDDFVFFWSHRPKGRGSVGAECLSQWYMAPMEIDGQTYNCVEQYLMAEKARTFGDSEVESQIMQESSQMIIKRLGRQVKNYDNTIWGRIRHLIAKKANIAKFSQNPALRDFILSTGDKILVEASPKDTIWGIGLVAASPDAPVPERWRGTNILGFVLMDVRAHLAANN